MPSKRTATSVRALRAARTADTHREDAVDEGVRAERMPMTYQVGPGKQSQNAEDRWRRCHGSATPTSYGRVREPLSAELTAVGQHHAEHAAHIRIGPADGMPTRALPRL